LKITGTELRQELAQLIYEYSGASDMFGMTINGVTVLGSTEPRPNPAMDFLDSRKLSIYGGTNEIQRNIIAKSVLGD
jgi:alkylation response protein AidB-like acyl-CoA dehydrogenase